MGDGQKAAFITGGSSGIGLGLAAGFLREGYAVTVVARRQEKLMTAVEGLRELGPVYGHAADVRAEHEIEAAVAAHRERFGRLDVLVNNAGVAMGEPLERTSAKAIDLALSVNLRAALLCTRATIGMLVAAAPSQVFNISSLAGLEGQAGMTAYSSSKAGLIGFTEALRAEFAGRGVKATAVCPAFVDTAMSDPVRSTVAQSDLIPVEDIVGVVLALVRLSPACVIPTVAFESAGGGLQGWSGVAERMAVGL